MLRRELRVALLAVTALAAAGCSQTHSDCATSLALAPQKTDVIFVVDNATPSMAEKQVELVAALPAFLSVLQQDAGVPQDFQVGLITTSVDLAVAFDGGIVVFPFTPQEGKLQPVLDATPDGGVVLGTGTQRVLSGTDPDLADKLGRLVRVGTIGSGTIAPFEALRLATTFENGIPLDAGGNQGFLRDGAQLAVIVVAATDDCSQLSGSDAGWIVEGHCGDAGALLTPVSVYFQALQTLVDSAGDSRPVVWEDIAPVGIGNQAVGLVADDAGVLRNVDCPDSFGAGFRLEAMAQLFEPGADAGALEDLDSVCDPSLAPALVDLARRAVFSPTVEVVDAAPGASLEVNLTRAGGGVQTCTTGGTVTGGQFSSTGSIALETTDGGRQLVHLLGSCARRFDDVGFSVQPFCAD